MSANAAGGWVEKGGGAYYMQAVYPLCGCAVDEALRTFGGRCLDFLSCDTRSRKDDFEDALESVDDCSAPPPGRSRVVLKDSTEPVGGRFS